MKAIPLENWVYEKHNGQFVKKTNLPYFDHLEFVAKLAGQYTPLGYEVGLCHDLLEKTSTSPEELYETLLGFGIENAQMIVEQVIELTDVYTKAAYPDWPKSKRKLMEEERLVHISPGAQIVKYADLVYNMNWMQRFRPGKAAEYTERKTRLLSRMDAVKGLI
jgi:(p)ppGpp synthase/HD superfamily hydrolase